MKGKAMLYYISTTIKRKWMDLILSGEKQSEFKGNTKFWNKRLTKIQVLLLQNELVFINFLCGVESYKYKVKWIIHHITIQGKDIDGKKSNDYWEIVLGKRIK